MAENTAMSNAMPSKANWPPRARAAAARALLIWAILAPDSITVFARLSSCTSAVLVSRPVAMLVDLPIAIPD